MILGKGSSLGSAGHHNHPPAALVPSGPACMVQEKVSLWQVQDIGHFFIRAAGMVLCARCSSVARRGSKSEVSEVVSESIFLPSKIFLMAGLWLLWGWMNVSLRRRRHANTYLSACADDYPHVARDIFVRMWKNESTSAQAWIEKNQGHWTILKAMAAMEKKVLLKNQSQQFFPSLLKIRKAHQAIQRFHEQCQMHSHICWDNYNLYYIYNTIYNTIYIICIYI